MYENMLTYLKRRTLADRSEGYMMIKDEISRAQGPGPANRREGHMMIKDEISRDQGLGSADRSEVFFIFFIFYSHCTGCDRVALALH